MIIEAYINKQEENLFYNWLSQREKKDQLRILKRIEKIQEGHLGDFKNLKQNLYELRFHFNSGFRVYFTMKNNKIVILLCAGNKKTQSKNIQQAREYIKDLQQEKTKQIRIY
jgi:putative addiction module killer protein